MTLSKYERRVLEEFEIELDAPGRRWRRGRWVARRLRPAPLRGASAPRRRRGALWCALAGVAACVVVIAFVPPVAAAVVAALVGLITGGAVATAWRPSAPPRMRS